MHIFEKLKKYLALKKNTFIWHLCFEEMCRADWKSGRDLVAALFLSPGGAARIGQQSPRAIEIPRSSYRSIYNTNGARLAWQKEGAPFANSGSAFACHCRKREAAGLFIARSLAHVSSAAATTTGVCSRSRSLCVSYLDNWITDELLVGPARVRARLLTLLRAQAWGRARSGARCVHIIW